MADFLSVFGPLPEISTVEQGLRGITTFSDPNSYSARDNFPRYAAAIAKSIGPNITTTQLRKFYTYVKSIEIANRHSPPDSTEIKDGYKLHFLLPKIAGTGKRERERLEGLYKILGVCLLEIDGKKKIMRVADLRVFVEFFEAILDYHASIEKSVNHN